MLGAQLVLCLALTSSCLSAQSMECGTPDIPLAQMEQILANLPDNPIVAGGSPIRVPIYFFQIRESDGSTTHPGFDLNQQMGVINQFFDGILEFYVCGSDFIDSSDYYSLDLATEALGLHTYVNANYEPTVSHCVKVFLVGPLNNGISSPSGYAHDRIQFNENAAIYFNVLSNEVIAHELGHYFGLPHTFANPSMQYVHDLANPILINGTLSTCHHTGDGFCDTPADLDVCIENASCTVATCTVTDPLGVAYSPDPTFLMSNYQGCTNRFSSEQTVRMLTLYHLEGNYAPLKDIPDECAGKTGKILNHCLVGSNQFPDPFADVEVILREIIQNCLDITDGAGNYDIKPANCNIGNAKRSILPDLDWGGPLNGVTSYDLVLLSKHILGIEILDSPFKLIAADVNYSGSVTSFDIVTTRKIILGITLNFPENRSWRYVPNLYLGNQSFHNQFYSGNPFSAKMLDPFGGNTVEREYKCPPDPLNPNNPPPPIPNNCTWMDHVSVIPTDPLAQLQNTWSFTGVKVGDLNCGAISNGLQEPPPSEEDFDSETAPITALENLLQINASTIPLKFYNASGEKISVSLKLNAVSLSGMKGSAQNERTDVGTQFKKASATPNPFGGTVDFTFDLAADAPVDIRVFNMDGKLIAEKGGYPSQGQHEIQISGMDQYSPGVYSYSITSEGTVFRGKLVKKQPLPLHIAALKIDVFRIIFRGAFFSSILPGHPLNAYLPCAILYLSLHSSYPYLF